MSDQPPASNAAARQAEATLLMVVGKVVVSAGHLELQLRRVLLHLDGQTIRDMHRVAGLGWQQLWERLSERLTSPRAEGLTALLAAYNFEQLRTLRNNVVHGNVLLNHAPDLTVTRHTRDGRKWIALGTAEETEEAAHRMTDLARALFTWLAERPKQET